MPPAASLGLLLALHLATSGMQTPAQSSPPPAAAQTSPQTPAAQPQEQAASAPMPDIPTLLHEVELHQKASEAAQKEYLYKVTTIETELDSHGKLKKTTALVADSFTIDGIRVNRVTSRNGKDLTPDEQKAEIERTDKEIAKARERRRKAQAEGKEVDPNGRDEITVSRFLELGAFTHPRRELRNGRSTIAVDFTGDPKSKSHNAGESLIRDLAGTVWIDEQDRAIFRIEGHAVDNFHIGGGLLVSLKQGTTFSLQMVKINSEAWLPSEIQGHGSLRYLLFFGFNGEVRITCTDYRKFQATSTILPGAAAVPATPPSSEPPPAPQP